MVDFKGCKTCEHAFLDEPTSQLSVDAFHTSEIHKRYESDKDFILDDKSVISQLETMREEFRKSPFGWERRAALERAISRISEFCLLGRTETVRQWAQPRIEQHRKEVESERQRNTEQRESQPAFFD